MMTRTLLFLLAMLTGLSAAQAADRSRAQPTAIALGMVAALAVDSEARAVVDVRRQTRLPLANTTGLGTTRSPKPLPARNVAPQSTLRLRPDVALE